MSAITGLDSPFTEQEYAALEENAGDNVTSLSVLFGLVAAKRKLRRYRERQAKHDAQLRANKETIKYHQDRAGNLAYENFRLRLEVGRLEEQLNEQTHTGGKVPDTAGNGDTRATAG